MLSDAERCWASSASIWIPRLSSSASEEEFSCHARPRHRLGRVCMDSTARFCTDASELGGFERCILMYGIGMACLRAAGESVECCRIDFSGRFRENAFSHFFREEVHARGGTDMMHLWPFDSARSKRYAVYTSLWQEMNVTWHIIHNSSIILHLRFLTQLIRRIASHETIKIDE